MSDLSTHITPQDTDVCLDGGALPGATSRGSWPCPDPPRPHRYVGPWTPCGGEDTGYAELIYRRGQTPCGWRLSFYADGREHARYFCSVDNFDPDGVSTFVRQVQRLCVGEWPATLEIDVEDLCSGTGTGTGSGGGGGCAEPPCATANLLIEDISGCECLAGNYTLTQSGPDWLGSLGEVCSGSETTASFQPQGDGTWRIVLGGHCPGSTLSAAPTCDPGYSWTATGSTECCGSFRATVTCP